MVIDFPLTVADAVAGGLAGAFLGGAIWARSVVAAKSKPVQIKTRFMRCFSSGQSLVSGTARRDDCRTPRPTCGSGTDENPVMMRQGNSMADTPIHETPGARFRAALAAEKPLQVAGAINAYAARLAQAAGFRAIYLSGGGVAANSLGIPDLGISSLEDVLTDVRRITDACPLPLLVDVD